MNNTQIPYQQTGYFSKLMVNYLEEKEELKPFYNHYCDIDSFAKIIEERKQKLVNRTVLVEALTQQNVDVNASGATKKNIQNLKSDNCFTVTTGHQLNLFTGPLYFIYKIVSTINLAKELKIKYPENDFVPVYWMATEDHDFKEINHFNLFKKSYALSNSKKGAVGRLKLEGVEELLLNLKEDLGDRNGVKEIMELFSKFYVSSNTYTEAIKGIVNELLGKYGLVIIDGDDKQLKGLFTNEIKRELLDRKNHQLINQTSEKLKEIGFKAQVTPREINIFYLREGLRERIVFEEGKYKVLHTELQFSESEILQELEDFPERFSPNAPMRCLYQEKILPNLVYIGGGGELAYWFQLKNMFDANNISYPILVLRNSVLFVDKGSNKRLLKLEIEPSDLFKDIEILIKEYLKNGSKIILELSEEEKSIEDVFEAIVIKAGGIDQSLQPFVKAELQKSIKSLKNIESRLIKAEKQKEEVAVNQIRNLKEKLFPNNSLQERHDNLISILIFYREGVIDELINQLEPLDKQFVILSAE
ncbi:MAG: bacillithiol biosynthesis cysteine-adding enzyme BshC [Flavobacteriales bacterium]|nr:MAG: bacillithiol biosynthesis cysteine-adding enzyme BshC [Flavobacteriales bacterium]